MCTRNQDLRLLTTWLSPQGGHPLLQVLGVVTSAHRHLHEARVRVLLARRTRALPLAATRHWPPPRRRHRTARQRGSEMVAQGEQQLAEGCHPPDRWQLTRYRTRERVTGHEC